MNQRKTNARTEKASADLLDDLLRLMSGQLPEPAHVRGPYPARTARQARQGAVSTVRRMPSS
ncbi:MAG: hypothetical protein R3348_03165 [Xanthomonadales bacterium]|nr:hypothetical protein [Xanthomonadales bacterium]